MRALPQAVQPEGPREFLNHGLFGYNVPDNIGPQPPGMGAAGDSSDLLVVVGGAAPRGHAPPKGLTELPNGYGKGVGSH